MNEIISKISSYNFFNNLLPGIIFSVLLEKFTHYSLLQNDILVGIFLYYFVGLIISRIGSLAVEPFLKWIKFLKFSGYKDFVNAVKNDKKIEIYSEQNNMYRTFISMFLLVFLLKGYERIITIYPYLKEFNQVVLLLFLFCLFLISYKKQTNYITKRISLDKK